MPTRTKFRIASTIVPALAALAAGAALSGCNDSGDQPENTSGVYATGAQEAGQQQQAQQGGMGSGAEIGGGQATGMDDDAPGSEPVPEGMRRIAFRGLRMFVPADWAAEPPASSMRDIQLGVPAVEGGEGGPTVFVVYGGISGSVEANIDRWVGQFTSTDGSEIVPKMTQQQQGGLRITTAELRGAYAGMRPEESGPDVAMIQSIIEKPSGEMIFVRLLGPSATVTANRDAFFEAMATLGPAQ